jgi:hypothetical protein
MQTMANDATRRAWRSIHMKKGGFMKALIVTTGRHTARHADAALARRATRLA